jgi:hypothetical protein
VDQCRPVADEYGTVHPPQPILCEGETEAARRHEETHRDDVLSQSQERQQYCDDRLGDPIEQAKILADWEIHAYAEAAAYLEALLEQLEALFPECF